MTDRAALLDAILHQPFEDTPRLMLADWCDEHGEGERAEFIRLQIEIARGESADRQREFELLARNMDASSDHPELSWAWHGGDDEYRFTMFPVPPNLQRKQSGWGPAEIQVPGSPARQQFRRGFPASVTLPDLAAWERWGESIVRAAPVTEIVISDRSPGCSEHYPGAWRYYADEHPEEDSELPDDLFYAVAKLNDEPDVSDPGATYPRWYFKTAEAARLALARAAADVARSRADLPNVWLKEPINAKN